MISYLIMLSQLFQNPIIFFVWAFALVVAITIHEFAHAYVADHLGDPTPRSQGRLTLNPLAHLDPIGTLMMLLTRFGWGKPVQFDPFNLQNPRRDAALISLAGPASNLLLATLLSLSVRFLSTFNFSLLIFNLFAVPVIVLNVTLAIFNLIPIHPLDGGKIVVGFLPRDLAQEWDDIMHRYGTLILLFLILPLFGSSPITQLISPVIDTILKLLLP